MFDGGIKIHGGSSRNFQQKSFQLFARNQYGTEEINYPLFPNSPYNKYQAFLLRNAGSDFHRAHSRDAILTSLMDGSGLETQSYRPIVVYINGEYWGLYNLREKINEHFLSSKSGVESNQIDIVDPIGRIIHGGNNDFVELKQFLIDSTLVSEANYAIVSEKIDIDNYIIYLLSEIYFDNRDWPYINIRHWRPKDGKWRAILFDTDNGFGRSNPNAYDKNTLAYALDPSSMSYTNNPNSNRLFRRLMDNEIFKNKFINQFADELNSRFLTDHVIDHIDSMSQLVSTEIIDQYIRWNANPNNYNSHINIMKEFATKRPAFVKNHIVEYFELPAFHQVELTVSNQEHGYIKINSLEIRDSSWTGDYFQDVPITVTAKPKFGYTFSHWENGSISTDATLVLNIQDTIILNAIFEADQVDRPIIINEINYKSSEELDTGDWIDLFNSGETTIDLSNWIITDKTIDEGFSIPENTSLESGEFLILARDIDDFNQYYNLENVIGNLNFGLSSNGDEVKLYDRDSMLYDRVAYLPTDPWPSLANGTGRTLELISPELDNSLPINWESINISGSPGLINEEIISSVENINSSSIAIYPNPFNDIIKIEFIVKQREHVKLSLLDMRGNLVVEIEDDILVSGLHKYSRNLGHLNTGKYFLRIDIGNDIYTRKWVKK
jgi:hypothetical protein